MAFGITTLSIMSVSISGLIASFGLTNTQHNSFQCHYAERRVFIVMLSVVMLNVVIRSVVMLSVVAPLKYLLLF
jgi:hypothetical protein